jgi:hypothetical protein
MSTNKRAALLVGGGPYLFDNREAYVLRVRPEPGMGSLASRVVYHFLG